MATAAISAPSGRLAAALGCPVCRTAVAGVDGSMHCWSSAEGCAINGLFLKVKVPRRSLRWAREAVRRHLAGKFACWVKRGPLRAMRDVGSGVGSVGYAVMAGIVNGGNGTSHGWTPANNPSKDTGSFNGGAQQTI